MAAEPRAPALLPWAWPWAVGVVAGAALGELAVAQAAAADAGDPARAVRWLVVASGVALAIAIGLVRAAGPAATPAGRVGAWFAAGALLAALRTASVLGTADPWVHRLGQVVAFEARVVDGVAWPLDGAGRGLVLRGAEVPDGRAWLEGRLEALPGRRNPGGFDARAHYRRDGVGAALVVARSEARAPPPASTRTRAALRRGVVAGLDADAAALMQALTLGVRGDLGPLRQAFASSGLAHVLALSGLHVGVLAAVLVGVVGGVGRVRSVVVVAVLLGYVAVVGTAPAVVRATAMVAFALLGRAFGIGGVGWGSHLALAAAASLLARPAWVGDLGFQLSYLSVLGMGWLAPPLVRRWGAVGAGEGTRRRGRGSAARVAAGGAVRRWVGRSVAVSLAAQAATLPLVASAFGAVPLAAPLANLVAIPLASALVPLGFVAGLAGLVAEPLAAVVNRATAPVAAALLALATATARVPTLPWGSVSWVGYAAYAIGSAAVVAGLHGAWRPWRAAVVVATAMMVTVAVPPAWRPPDLFVLDVGQGDATVVRVARGQALLVDGGGTPFGSFDVGARTVVPALRALGVGALPLVVATHPDLDHVEGLVAVLHAFPVGALMVGHAAPDVPAYRALTDAAEARGVPIVEARRGARYRVGGAVLDVVHPEGRPRGEANADSVGLLVRWGEDPWALLLGDVPAEVEATLPVPPTPVLLAPHHGSGSSSSEALLRAARPRLAVISVGVNRYGHPAPAVVARFAAAAVRVRTTREEGAVRVPYPVP